MFGPLHDWGDAVTKINRAINLVERNALSAADASSRIIFAVTWADSPDLAIHEVRSQLINDIGIELRDSIEALAKTNYDFSIFVSATRSIESPSVSSPGRFDAEIRDAYCRACNLLLNALPSDPD